MSDVSVWLVEYYVNDPKWLTHCWYMCVDKLPRMVLVKDVLMGIPKSDLLGVTMAAIHVAGQFLSVEVISLTVVK